MYGRVGNIISSFIYLQMLSKKGWTIMSDKLITDSEFFDTMVQSSVKFDDLIETIVDIVESQTQGLVSAQLARGDSPELIEAGLDHFQTFMNLMTHLAEGVVHLFDGYARHSLPRDEVVKLFMELALIHEQRGGGLISQHFTIAGMIEKMMSGSSPEEAIAMSGQAKDDYGPN